MAPPVALLLPLALATALGQPDPCEYETNRIKDLLQAGCEGKGLTEVPAGLASGTGILLLGSNRLARVSTASFRHLRNLTDLDLSGNGMGELEAAAPLPGLQELDLSRNALKSLPALQGFPGLTRLALGHNALSWLPEGGFRALGDLVDLELQGNQLQRLPEGAFAGLAALKDLDVSDNRLAALPPELLAGLGALETLRLERNRLRSVPEGFFPEGQLFAYVYLTGNPWRCDCALEYLRDWIAENSFSVYTRLQGPGKEITENAPQNVTCHDPPEQRGHPVMDVSHADCRPEGGRGVWGDGEEIAEPQAGPSGPDPSPHGLPPLFPATTTAFFTQPETAPPTPSLPTGPATPLAHSATPPTPPATTDPPATGVPTAPATSTSGRPPASTTAAPSTSPTPPATTDPPATGVPTAPAPSPSPTPPATTDPPATGAPGWRAASTSGLPPAPATATPTLGEPPTRSPPPQATSITPAPPAPTTAAPARPAPTGPGSAARPPSPPLPAHCHCPMLPGGALGLTGQRPPPVPWGAWLAARCCPGRLAGYVACLLLASLPALAVLCGWAWVCAGPWAPHAPPSALGCRPAGHRRLQTVPRERRPGPGEGGQPLPGRRVYRVCERLEVLPLRYVTWLLVSLPGPSGQWPWERKDGFPSSSGRKGSLGAAREKDARAPL